MTFLADNFADIKHRMAQFNCDTPDSLWWCDKCQNYITADCIYGGDPENPRCPDCRDIIYEDCTECGNGGYVETYSPRPPAFTTCEKCYNPFGHKKP